MVILLGIACGWFIGVVFTVLVAHLAPYLSRERPGFLARIPATTNMASFAILALGLAILYWGIVGAILGAFHNLASVLVPRSGLASPNLVFTLGVAAVAIILGLRLARGLPWARPQVGIMTFAIVLLFGWVLPLLAA